MQCVFSFGNRSVPNAKIVALSEINLAFGLKNGPAHGELAPHRQAALSAQCGATQVRQNAAQWLLIAHAVRRSKYVLVGFQQDSVNVAPGNKATIKKRRPPWYRSF